ncbi:MAG: phospholipid carrier-dependent glycosyltransferase [Vicinamibacterales bacterium]
MKRVEALVVLTIITAAFYTGLDRVRFHVDESAWIGLSATFEAFFTGRFSNPIWQERQDKLVVAPVTHYVIGAARRIGGFPPERLNLPWRWFVPYETNAAEGRMPEPRLLWWARAGVTTAAIGALFVFFRLLSRAAGRPAAYAWLALALVNPYLRETLRRAMNEGVLLSFLALVIWAASRALPHLDRSPEAPGARERAAAWLVIAAVAAGLAAQTKLNGAMAVPGVMLLVLVASLRTPARSSQKLRQVALAWALLAAVSFGTFIGANPTLWPEPARNTVRSVRARAEVMKDQLRREGGPGQLGTADRAGVVLTRVFSEYSVVPLRVAGPILFATGMTAAVAGLVVWMRRASQNHALVSLVVVGATVSVPMLFTPLDWPRMYMLPVFFFGFATAAGLAWVARRAWGALSEARARQ